MLEQLHFLDSEAIHNAEFELSELLLDNKPDLMIFTKAGDFNAESDDVKNLF